VGDLRPAGMRVPGGPFSFLGPSVPAFKFGPVSWPNGVVVHVENHRPHAAPRPFNLAEANEFVGAYFQEAETVVAAEPVGRGWGRGHYNPLSGKRSVWVREWQTPVGRVSGGCGFGSARLGGKRVRPARQSVGGLASKTTNQSIKFSNNSSSAKECPRSNSEQSG
jgi:hypothetical protein